MKVTFCVLLSQGYGVENASKCCQEYLEPGETHIKSFHIYKVYRIEAGKTLNLSVYQQSILYVCLIVRTHSSRKMMRSLPMHVFVCIFIYKRDRWKVQRHLNYNFYEWRALLTYLTFVFFLHLCKFRYNVSIPIEDFFI